ATGVDQLLLAGEEGVALVAELDPKLVPGGPGDEGVAARAPHGRGVVPGVDVGSHDASILPGPLRWAVGPEAGGPAEATTTIDPMYWPGNAAKMEVVARLVELVKGRDAPLTVFDYGCGSGGDWPRILAEVDGFEVVGYEPNER